ncbi:DUF2605 domain-containing protein [filamentous cyanobacterium LEGE 11480]|uniref:DUF2605 domain-containing protein n=1 Tax=Romeriopsis navalis LEGE 11480 TaxID=2777977 RepID=A0A928VRI7_9CYAN|nr:DUF2605 domain-containing protein [Romeriopsis navalis]MBE9033321.1 DUF2605 domain-containing protein [Romeriopsis navalis LEGE 11480]
MFALPPDPDLLKQVLAPLLEDFQYWFERSSKLLQSTQLDFMDAADQQDLLGRVLEAQQAVQVAQSLLAATDGQAGVEMTVLMGWHKLVTECWSLSMQHRSENKGSAQ